MLLFYRDGDAVVLPRWRCCCSIDGGAVVLPRDDAAVVLLMMYLSCLVLAAGHEL
jgi:hypothetical protein